jgi:hypothetical protein
MEMMRFITIIWALGKFDSHLLKTFACFVNVVNIDSNVPYNIIPMFQQLWHNQ